MTRPHTLAEVFSTLTGKGLPTATGRQSLHPDDVAEILSDLPKLKFVELTAGETLKAVREAGAKGVRGGLVHDWLHVLAAQKAKAGTVVTENTQHFQALTGLPLQDFASHVAR